MSHRFVSNILPRLQDDSYNPVSDYGHLSILTLEEAVQKISDLVPHAMSYARTAKKNCNRDSTLLTWNESAAIYFYTMPKDSSCSSFNVALRAANRQMLTPWLEFLKLLITALEKLPSIKTTIWRGVNHDEAVNFVDTNVYTWWSITSCSTNISIVEKFMDENGTLFAIETMHGKDVSIFSAVSAEQEVILMPGTRVRVKSESFNFINRLFIIHLEEISPEIESNHIFEQIKQEYRRNNRIERFMNPAISFPIEQSYINLSIVENKEQRQKEKRLQNAQRTTAVIGAYEDIYGTKTTVDVNDIFKTCKDHQKQVLVFGRAGIGKSTFCKYIAYQWAMGSFLSQYELLALIPLHRLTVHRYPSTKSYSLIDLLKREVFSLDMTEKEEEQLKKQFDAKKTLWILDGYDEIVQNIPPHLQPLLEQLLKTPHHIITSRPYLNTLSYNVQMEIIGFTDENIKNYIQSFFRQINDEPNDTLLKDGKLLNFLQSNASIWGVAHIPVNLELICSLWSNSDWPNTKQLTMTRLYTMMTEWLCRRYLMAQGTTIQTISISQMYQRCQKELTFLESLAFHAMESNTILIRPLLLEKASDEANLRLEDYSHILNMGILKSVNKHGINTQIETDKDHYFVHLSFQEYFAARYLMNALKRSQAEKSIEFIKHHKYNQRYTLLFSFTAGLLSEKDAESYLDLFWNTLLGPPVDLVGIRHMQLLIVCLEETNDKTIFPRRSTLLEWIAECLKHSFITKNKMIRNNLSQSLRRSQSIACDAAVANVLIDFLRRDDVDIKVEVLLLIIKLKLINPSIALITSVTSRLDDENEQIRGYACCAVGKIDEKAITNEVISKLVSALEDQSEWVREHASNVLRNIGEKAVTNEVIIRLWSALEDQSEQVKQYACEALGEIGEKAATNEVVISKLVAALEDENESVRANACKALGKIGETAATNKIISELVSALENQREWVRRSACYVLGKIGEKAATNEVISKLVRALEDESEQVRQYACEALGEIGKRAATSEVISKLVAALEDENENVRVNACEALEKIGQEGARNEVISKLASALDDQSEWVIIYAYEILGKIGRKVGTNEVVSKLVSALEDQREMIRRYACQAIGKIGEKAATNEVIGKLVSALEDQSELVRRYACEALGKIGEKAGTNGVICKLMHALEDLSGSVRANACEALGKIGEKAGTNEVISKLMITVEDQMGSVRASACEALGKIGEKAGTNEVISKLMIAVEDQSWSVRASACEALGKIGDKAGTNEVISKLMIALEDHSGSVRRYACEALGTIGEKAVTNEVISKLGSALEDQSERVRANAFVALGKIGEKAATNEVISKLVSLVNSDQPAVFSSAEIFRKILSSSLAIKHLNPKIIAELFLCDGASDYLKNISERDLINIFFDTKNLDWLSAATRLAVLRGAAVICIGDRVIVYGNEGPLEIPLRSFQLCKQLVETFSNQAEQLHLHLKMPTRNLK